MSEIPEIPEIPLHLEVLMGIGLVVVVLWTLFLAWWRKAGEKDELDRYPNPETPERWLEYSDWHARLADTTPEFREHHLREVEYGKNVAQWMLEKRLREEGEHK